MAYRNTKRDTVKALLSNKNMSKIIQDALQSPVGSTPRKRAQKIVSIMRKIQRNDGVGGPGIVPTSGPTPTIPQISKRKVRGKVRVFQDVPMRGAKIFDGAGGPGIVLDPQGKYSSIGVGMTLPSLSSSTSSNIFTTNKQFSGNAVASPDPLKVSSLNLGKNSQYQGLLSSSSIPSTTASTPSSYQGLTVTRTGSTTPSTSYGGNAMVPASANLLTTKYPNASQLTVNQSTKPFSPGTYSSFGVAGTQAAQGTGTPGSQGGASTTSGSFQGPVFDPTYGSGTGSQTGGGSSMTSGMYSSISNPMLRDALQSGMGSAAFAYGAMGDIKKLRTLPGFENVPDDALPFGADLSGQFDYLYETLKREEGLNAAMDELESAYGTYGDLIQGGVGLNQRLADYIKRKDEFLNETNGMIDDFKDKLVNGSIDMYNPVVAKQAESYLGYLSTMKGRQNNRYIDWVNKSVDVYNQQLQAQENLVQTAMNMYTIKNNNLKERYDRGEKIALLEYQQIYNGLTEMYNTAAGLPQKQMEMEMWQAELEKTRLDSILSTMEDTKGFEKLSADYIKAFDFVNGNIYDKDGNYLPGARNISALLSTYAGDSETAPEAVFDAYTKGIASDFSGGKSVADMMTNAQAHYQGISQFQEYYTQLAKQEGLDPSTVINKSKQLSSAVTAPLIDGVTTAITSSPEATEEFKRAVKAITNPSKFFGLAKGSVPSRDEYLKNYTSANLPKGLLNALYNAYESYKSQPDFLWHIYANPAKYDKDPGLDRMSPDEFVGTAVGNSLYGASQYNPIY